MGLDDEASSSIRISLGRESTADHVDGFAAALVRVAARARAAAGVTG
jgi:cysteine sulfinate desulfinase/cysteine desulfurase-like protein